MKIEQLTLENFKCFKTEKTFDFSKLTILTGANSSGKSSVIYGILGALQSENFPYTYSTNGKFVNLGDFREIVYKNNRNSTITINLKVEGTKYYTILREDKIDHLPKCSFIKVEDNDLNVFFNKPDSWNIEIGFNDVTENLYEIIISEINNLLRNDLGMKKITVYSKENKKVIIEGYSYEKFMNNSVNINWDTYRNPNILSSLINNINFDYQHILFEDIFAPTINFIGPFRHQPQNINFEQIRAILTIGNQGEGYLDQIVEWEKRSNEKLNELVKVMKDLNLVEDIKTKRLSGGRFEVLVKPTNSSVLTALSNVGFGISQFLPIIVADLQLPDDSTLFLAEPEIHLHPSVQSKFGEYIVNQINNTEKNYVIETHSEYFLNRIRLAIVKGELKKEDIKVYFLENKNDDTDVHDIEFTKTGVIKNAPDNFFETYYADSMAITLNAFAE